MISRPRYTPGQRVLAFFVLASLVLPALALALLVAGVLG